MDGQCIEERARTGPVRPPRPSQSLDYIRPSPRATPRNSADLPAMMRKRLSTKNVKSTSQLQNQLSPGLSPSFRYSGAGSTTASERKGSFKNVVRKLFGRRLKYGGSSPEISRPTPSGHGYHRSDPGQFIRTQALLAERAARQNPPASVPSRVLSAPAPFREPPPLASPALSLRTRSPAALHFPKSAQLKPLDLGNPFYHRTNRGSKRRATLPTLDFVNNDSVPVGTALGSPPDSGMGRKSPETPLAIPESEIGLAVTSTPRTEKRRSRSAHDLRQTTVEQRPTRKRSEEIRFWRESFAGTVLLNHDTPPMLDDAGEVGDELGNDENNDADNEVLVPFNDHANVETPEFLTCAAPRSVTDQSNAKDSSPLIENSRPPTADAERTEELERRIAKLESSLQDFHFSLERLTMDSRARTLTPAFEPRPRLRRNHTPSILIDTLQQPTWRPQSFESPREVLKYEDAGDVLEREWDGSARRDRPFTPDMQSRPASYGGIRQSTVIGLYDQLAEERAARYRLETQFQSLQREVTAMATRLERGSWNSYSIPAHPILHPPRTPEESERGASRDSTYDARADPRFVSRFSGSDSVVESEIYAQQQHRQELMNVEEEAQTPYELYRTPLEEHVPYRFSQDDEMF